MAVGFEGWEGVGKAGREVECVGGRMQERN